MHQEVFNLMFDFNSIKIIISLSSMLTKMLNKSFYLFWKNAKFSGYYNTLLCVRENNGRYENVKTTYLLF